MTPVSSSTSRRTASTRGIRWLRGFCATSATRARHPGLQPHAQEVQQTADDIVIINNGRLIRSGTLAELSGGRGTVVRSSDLDSLAGALRIADVESAPGPDDTLIAETTDLRLVGDVALRAGLPIWELKAKQADLEELFFSLTEGTNRNLGDATYPDSAAPTERDALAGQEGANL